MARRSMAGQLNMFDFWDNLVQPEDGGQVQMVSLIPEEEPKQERAEEVDEETAQEEPVAQKAVLPESAPVMQKQVLNPDGSIKAEVAFYNYNKVCVKRENEPEEWREFDNSKEAVEYYMEEMLKLQPENGFEDKGEDDE